MSPRADRALLAILQRPGGLSGGDPFWVDHPEDLPLGWSTQLEGGPLPQLTPEGLAELARVADWAQHTRSWGAHLIRGWLRDSQEARGMRACYQEFPAHTPGLESMVWGWPESSLAPRVVGPWDEAAWALVEAKGDHAAAMALTGCPRAKRLVSLAPLSYLEGLEVYMSWLTEEKRRS